MNCKLRRWKLLLSQLRTIVPNGSNNGWNKLNLPVDLQPSFLLFVLYRITFMCMLLCSELKICNGSWRLLLWNELLRNDPCRLSRVPHAMLLNISRADLWLVELHGNNRSQKSLEIWLLRKVENYSFWLQGLSLLRILIRQWFTRKCIETFFTIIIPWMRHSLWCGLWRSSSFPKKQGS